MLNRSFRVSSFIARVYKQRFYTMSESGAGIKRPLDRGEGEEEEEKEEGKDGATATTSSNTDSTENDSPPTSKLSPSHNNIPWWKRIGLMKRSASTQAKDKDYWQKLSLEDKRKCYKCGNKYLTLDGIKTWPEFYAPHMASSKTTPTIYPVNNTLNSKISIFQGDITTLEIDAIVNAANSSLMGGGGVDGAIHSAAGYSLRDECALLGGCDTGDTKITTGHRLPAKYILHTVGPFNDSARLLKSCYTACFQLVEEHKLRSVAFCCIATGVYGFPNEEAAKIALNTTRQWLESHHEQIDRIIFVVFLKKDYKLYIEHLQHYFPLSDSTTPDKSRETTPTLNEEESSEKDDGRGLSGETPPLVKSVTAPVHSIKTSEEKTAKMKETAVECKGEETNINEGCGPMDTVAMETGEATDESKTSNEEADNELPTDKSN